LLHVAVNVIALVTELHTPVEVLNIPPHPDCVNPANEYPLLEQVCAEDASP